MLVQVHDKGHSRPLRVLAAAGQDLRHIEHLETTDEGCDQNVDEYWLEERHRDPEEDLGAIRSINLGRLKEVSGDSEHA